MGIAQFFSNYTTLKKITEALNLPLWNGSAWPKPDLNLTDIDMTNQLGSPTHIDTLDEVYNHIYSAGVMHDATLTDNGDGTVNISSGTAVLRPTAVQDDDLVSIGFSAQLNIALTDNSVNYVYLDYNGGSPTFNVGTVSTSFNCLDKCLAYTIAREGTTLYIIDARAQNVDANRKHRRVLLEAEGFRHVIGGTALGETGTRNVTVTAGAFYYGLEKVEHTAFDTSGADTFIYYYRNGLGGWTKVTGQTQINNLLYDDGDGTLGTLGNNKYGVHWVYIINNSPSVLAVQYGQHSYNTIADAQAAPVPTSTPAIQGVGALIGRIIIQKSAASFAVVESAFTQTFVPSSATNHNGLAGIQGGTLNEYYHLTSTAYTDLTDSGATTLHKHDHGDQDGLLDDDHTQYALLAGRVGNQVLNGGTAASGTLTLVSTANATKGKILFGTSAYDEVNNRLGIGITAPEEVVHIIGNIKLPTTSLGVVGSIKWAGGSQLYEESNVDSVNRMIYQPNGDRFEVLNEAGSNYIAGFHGPNSVLTSRIILYHGLIIGSDAYPTTNPPLRGALIEGSVGIGQLSPLANLDILNSNTDNGLALKASTTLQQAAGNEVAYQLNYTTNKLTSGDDIGLQINMTDTASPGFSYPLHVQVGGATKFRLKQDGTLDLYGDIALGANNISFGSGNSLSSTAITIGQTVFANGNIYRTNSGGNMDFQTNGGIFYFGRYFDDEKLFQVRDSDGRASFYGNTGFGISAPTSRIHGVATLSEATGDEIAYQLNYTTNKATSGNDTGLQINMTDTASPGTSYLIDAKVNNVSKFSVSNTGAITLTGDAQFTGSGVGLPYGSCYGNEIAWAQASAVQNTWYEISDADMADGKLNNVTHDGNGKLTLAIAGTYLVNYSCSASCSAINHHINITISIDGTEQNDGMVHINTDVANSDFHLSGTAIITVTAGQTLEVSIRTIDSGTPDLAVAHLNITAVQIGG